MLFNSYEFIFVFLPIILILFYTVGARFGPRLAISILVVGSLFFYGWWNYHYLALLLSSICFNFVVGSHLAKISRTLAAKRILVFGIAVNLFLIGYFKYATFLGGNLQLLFPYDITLDEILLPLAISFFTFQQITFLVDAYRGLTKEYSFLQYCLFVSFFPQLIAGPIVHHGEMMPQFQRPGMTRLQVMNLSVGFTIFAIGLFKKAVLADGIAPYGNAVFAQAEAGAQLQFLEAWGGALCYTFQLYFDFSGYSDMAIGLARMFGIRLPLNFNSPYKAASIIDFWRRWHITLSRFLRDYVYFPLGGNRQGPRRRYLNLMATMLLGGLWHGAGWTFVFWGALHGLYLVVNHGWIAFCGALGLGGGGRTRLVGRLSGQMVTFLAVVVAWVFFRALTFDGALNMLTGMAGLNGVSLPLAVSYRVGPLADLLHQIGVVFYPGGGGQFLSTWLWISALMVIAFGFPNTQELMRRYRPAFNYLHQTRVVRVAWRPTVGWAMVTALLLTSGILALPQVSDFLYFQF